MSNKRATKRALLTSVMALVMCVVMLVGTTFAWFTDTASTGVNKIQAGNLDIELAYKNTYIPDGTPILDGGFAAVTENTKVFDEDALWEPGHVEYVVLKVSNVGTLALKYKLGINIADETGSKSVVDGKEFKLSDYIKFAVIDEDQSNLDRDTLVAKAGEGAVLSTGYTAEDYLLKDGIKTVTLVVWMPKSVGNEANYDAAVAEAPVINLGINVVATQYTYESDSFDETYDKNAQYPEVSYAQVSSQDDLNSALTNPTDANGNPTTKVAVELKKDGTYTLPTMTGKDVTIIGTKDTVIDVSTGAAHHGATIALEGVTVKGQTSGNFEGLMHTKKVTYKDCTITGKQTLYANDVEFINCTFDSGADYAIWTYGAKNVTFTDCKFNSTNNQKSVLCYSVLKDQTFTRTFNNCTFTSTGTGDKSAIMINPTESGGGTNTYIVNINNCTATGYSESGISGQTIVGLRNAGAGVIDTITVNINGTNVYTH